MIDLVAPGVLLLVPGEVYRERKGGYDVLDYWG
jgi:hypothetical protein